MDFEDKIWKSTFKFVFQFHLQIHSTLNDWGGNCKCKGMSIDVNTQVLRLLEW